MTPDVTTPSRRRKDAACAALAILLLTLAAGLAEARAAAVSMRTPTGVPGLLTPAPPPVPARPPQPLAPLAGSGRDQVLVYTGNDSDPDNGGNAEYTELGAATGRTVTTSATLPGDLSRNACVVLQLNSAPFDGAQQQTLARYMQGGGRVVAIGEYNTYDRPANFNLNALAASLGVTMALQDNTIDGDFHVTFSFGPSPYAADLSLLFYAATAGIDVGGSAQVIARTATGNVPFIAAQGYGDGAFVLVGDSNVLSDQSGGGYEYADNGALARSICGAGKLSLLVVGDSYSAGNGAGAYSSPSSCRRSAFNYAQEYARLLQQAPYDQRPSVENAACSGAVMEDFFRTNAGQPPQLFAIKPRYDAILLTIGGNDLAFSDIVKKCLLQATRDGADCDKLLTSAKRLLTDGTVGRSLTVVLGAIRRRADPRAEIVLLGYPYLEGDPNYRLRSGHFSNTFIEVGKRLRQIQDLGDSVEQQVVNALDSPPLLNNIAFVKTKALFKGHELYAQKDNAARWFIQPWTDASAFDHDLWYHPNRTGWHQEAALLLQDSRVPKHDVNDN